MKPTMMHKRDIYEDVLFPAIKISIFFGIVDLVYYLMFAKHIGK